MDKPFALATLPALNRPAAVARSIPLSLTPWTEAQYLNALCADIGKRFKDKSVGYQVAVMTPDGQWCGAAGGMARRAPDLGSRAMTTEEKITVASVSKTLTAAAMLHAMADRKVSVDAKIAGYLPAGWAMGANIDTITFRDLFTHRSGFRCSDKYGGTALLLAGLKKCVLDGVNLADKTQFYRNENYALMRILLREVLTKKVGLAMSSAFAQGDAGESAPPTGPIRMKPPVKPPGLPAPAGPAGLNASDYASFYISYVNQVVFSPIGLPQMFCKPTDAEPALSYKSATADPLDFSAVQPGEIWGDMTLACGSQGWNLSAHQLVMFMHGLTQTQSIVPAAIAQRMEDENLGLWYADNGNGLVSWSHGGFHPAEVNMGEVSTLIIAFNNGLSASVIVNSKFKGVFAAELVAAIKETPQPHAPPAQ